MQATFFKKIEILPFLPPSSLKTKLHYIWQSSGHVKHMWLIAFNMPLLQNAALPGCENCKNDAWENNTTSGDN